MDFSEIKHFIDCGGRLISLPAKHKKKLIALWYLADKIENGWQYSEHEINELLNSWTVLKTLRHFGGNCMTEGCLTGRPTAGNIKKKKKSRHLMSLWKTISETDIRKRHKFK